MKVSYNDVILMCCLCELAKVSHNDVILVCCLCEQGNITANDVIELFCGNNQQLSGDFLNISMPELNATLCGENTKLAQELANDLINYTQQLNRVWYQRDLYDLHMF